MKKTKEVKPTYEAALYLRLSKERLNEELGQSDSIANQESLLRAFLQTHPDIHIAQVFKDDGWSGVNFDRPAFQKMMQMIYDNKINCVVVKDLSRLGRNHTETGKYISRVFPAFDVRFIAVNDNVDTLKQNDDIDNIIVPFKGLLNDSYSRDISIKVRTSLETKRRQGLFVGGTVRFGYKRDPHNKNKLIIDEEAAAIVRQIFQWSIDGLGNTLIADKLNKMNFPCPAEYKKLKKDGKKAVSQNNGWYPIAINRILRDDTYIGVMTQGKVTTPNYKVKKVIRKNKDQVVRIEDAFEPIISKEDFQLVQSLLLRDVRISPNDGCIQPLCGFLYCGDCGGPMVRHSSTKNGKRYVYYMCADHLNNKEICFSHMIKAEKLEQAVLEAVNLQLSMLFDSDQYLKNANALSYSNRTIEQYQIQIARAVEQKLRFLELAKGCYQDYKDGLLTENEYRELKADYEADAKEAENTVIRLESEKQAEIEKRKMDVSWVERFREKGKLDSLNRRIVIAMIEKVEVFPENRVKVTFRHDNEIQRIYQIMRKEGA